MPKYAGFYSGLAGGLSSGIKLGLDMSKTKTANDAAKAQQITAHNKQVAEQAQAQQDFELKMLETSNKLTKTQISAKSLDGYNKAGKGLHSLALKTNQTAGEFEPMVAINVPRSDDANTSKKIVVPKSVADKYINDSSNYQMNNTNDGLQVKITNPLDDGTKDKDQYQSIPESFDHDARFKERTGSQSAWSEFYDVWKTENDGGTIEQARKDFLQKSSTTKGSPRKVTAGEIEKGSLIGNAVKSQQVIRKNTKDKNIDWTKVRADISPDEGVKAQQSMVTSRKYDKSFETFNDSKDSYDNLEKMVDNIEKLQDDGIFKKNVTESAMDKWKSMWDSASDDNAKTIAKEQIMAELGIEKTLIAGAIQKGALSNKDMDEVIKAMGLDITSSTNTLVNKLKGVKRSLGSKAEQKAKLLVNQGATGSVLTWLSNKQTRANTDEMNKEIKKLQAAGKRQGIAEDQISMKVDKIRQKYEPKKKDKPKGNFRTINGVKWEYNEAGTKRRRVK